MKITRIFFTIISFMIYSTASAEIDVEVLTRGGWNVGAEWCCFFKADGTGDVVGSTIVPIIKWTIEDDDNLILADAEGVMQRLEIKGATIHLSDGREGFHRPFAEEDVEISLRRGRKYADLTWHAPHSANTLSDMLHRKTWICDMPGASITFYNADTCLVSDFKRLEHLHDFAGAVPADVAQNNIEAEKCLDKAAAQGNKEAKKELAELNGSLAANATNNSSKQEGVVSNSTMNNETKQGSDAVGNKPAPNITKYPIRQLFSRSINIGSTSAAYGT